MESIGQGRSGAGRNQLSPVGRLEAHAAFPAFGQASPEVVTFHAELRDIILGEGYPCVGSRSAVNSETYRVGVYDAIGSERATSGLAHDIYEFCRDFTTTATNS